MNLRNLALLAFALAPVAHAEEPFKIAEALGVPDWLHLSGETRARIERLDGQFRAGGRGGDQLLLFRTLLNVEARKGAFALGFELQDSRTYLSDSGTPLGNSIANPLDFLQIYGRVQSEDFAGTGARVGLTIGRQTVSIGSKRQIERVDYANVIKSYTGGHFETKSADGDEFHAFYVVPVGRFPTDRKKLDDNALVFDEEQWNRRIWGLHYRRSDAFPALASNIWVEAFIYGLDESDSGSTSTPNRHYVSPGFRLYRPREAGQWDMDIEGAWRAGSRRETSEPKDTRDLDVSATVLFAALGYTFDNDLKLRLAAEYYWASGDEDPTDDNFDQHERLFGSRRTDLNNTSIHGPLTPANLNAPGFRIEIKPSYRFDARVAYSAAFLASATDAWVIAKLRDETGRSGDFVGHAIDGRARYWIKPETLVWEVGASALIFGEFAKNVPNGPAGSRTLFGYTQLTFYF